MSITESTLHISDLKIAIIRKQIKNLHLGVYPPDGRIRVAAPLNVPEESIRLAVVARLAWIKRQRKSFLEQARQSKRMMVSGESHFFRGQRYILEVQKTNAAHQVLLKGKSKLIIKVRPNTSAQKMLSLLETFYRQNLKQTLPAIIERQCRILGLDMPSFTIRKMKTRWGSCSANRNHILINLEMAKKPLECLEYIVAHELAHLIERKHNKNFTELLDKVLPKWREHRDLLNSIPLGYEEW